MSQRHRSDSGVLPPKEELRAHARSERHRVNGALHVLSSSVGRCVEPDDVDEPGVAWKPVHHRDAVRAKAKASRPVRVRHWKLKAWKRRSALRRQRAAQLRLATHDV
jgi:hypothetical protein